MAIPTTTITGTIVLPDGSAPYEATIEAEISQAGAYLDDGHSHLAIESVHVHCPSGVLPTFALIPNDAITPAGTYYRVTIRTKETSTSIAVRNVLLWQVDSAPDPIDIGAVIRLDAVPGTPVALRDATATVTGVIQLAGDLGGTAAAPTIAAGKIKPSHLGGAVDTYVPSKATGSDAWTWVSPGSGTGGGWVNAKAAGTGIVGDGVTDDAAAINALLAANAGRTIYFPESDYRHDSAQIEVPANTTIVGDGPRSTRFLRAGLVGTNLNLADDCTVRDLACIHDGATAATSGALIRHVKAAGHTNAQGGLQHITIENVRVAGGYDGIYLSGASQTGGSPDMLFGPALDRILIEANSHAGLRLNATGLCYVTRFWIWGYIGDWGWGGTNNGTGILLENHCESIELSDGDVLRCDVGIDIVGTASYYATQSRFARIYIDTCDLIGLRARYAHRLALSDIWIGFIAPSASGVGMDIAETYLLEISGGHIINTPTAITLANVLAGMTVKGVQIADCATIGIDLAANIGGFVIQGNVFGSALGPESPVTMARGIWLRTGTSNQYIIADNLFVGVGFASGKVTDGGSGTDKRVANNY